jgi:muramoyltetrapeptide carboxypeptidase
VDIIDIIAPGYGAKKEDIKLAENYIRKLGFTPRIPKDIFQSHPLHSHNDDYRLNHLITALKAKDSRAIWCFKGGYGTAKLIPALAKITPPKHKKTVIGFSDITALHLFLTQNWKWQTLHAPVLWQLLHDKVEDICGQQVKAYLESKTMPKFSLTPMNREAKNFCGSAKITGGNLALLQASIGTQWQLKARNKFLLIEEVDESAYRVDRMMLHLNQADSFNGVKAILLGDFTFADKPEEVKNTTTILQDFANTIAVPVFRIRDIGHGKLNNPLPFGVKAEIVNHRLTLSCNHPSDDCVTHHGVRGAVAPNHFV